MSRDKDFVHGQGYDRSDLDEVSDNPEWTAADVAGATPLVEIAPDLHAALTAALKPHGSTGLDAPVALRIDADVLQKLRATGPGWQSRANAALRDYVEKLG